MMCSDKRKQICRKLQTDDSSFDTSAILNAPAITVSSLSRHRKSFTVSFSKHSLNKQKSLTSLENGYNGQLEKKGYFLTGNLTLSSKAHIKRCLPGNVFLEDETDTVLCLVQGEYRIYENLTTDVFLTDWSFITDGSEGYIEVNGLVSLPPLSNEISDKAVSCNAISVQDARLTLRYRTELKPGRLNVCGNVSALSELIRMKTDHMFLMKLTDEDRKEINILVKRADQLHWQKFITPGEEYVFTNLRPTTVQKGTVLPTLVYVAWEGAKFIPKSQWSGEIVTLKDWLGLAELPLTVQGDDLAKDSEHDAQQSVYTYQGTITDASRSEVGIYQLDNKIRLYLSYIPAVQKFKSLRPGCRVTVYNAHHSGSPQPPKIRLVGCIQSCVKVTEFSPLDLSNIKSMDSNKSPSLYMIQQHSVNLVQFDQSLIAEAALKAKFGSVASSSVILGCLLCTSSAPNNPTEPWGGTWSPLQEFLSSDHNCAPFKQSEKKIPLVVRLGELSQRLSSLENAIHSVKEKFSHQQLNTEQLREKLYWSYDQQEIIPQRNNEVLVGVLQPSSVTGQLQLVDNTGAIDVVVAQHPENSTTHDCQIQDCGARGSSTHGKKCPFVQTSDVGSLVRVDRYCVTIELFLMSNFPTSKHIGDPQYIHVSRITPYLIVSMQDVHIIKAPVDMFMKATGHHLLL